MFCTECGHPLPDGAKFCPECGSRMDFLQEESFETSYEAPPVSQMSTPQEADETVRVNTYIPQEPDKTIRVNTRIPREHERANNSYSYEEPVRANNSFSYEEPVRPNSSSSYEESAGEPEKIHLEEYVSDGNIERFAPLAAFFPLAMGVLLFVFERILFRVFVHSYFTFRIVSFVMFAIRWFFVIAAVAAAVGLVCVITKDKRKSNASAWITFGGVVIAAIACICRAFGRLMFARLFGAVAFVLGLEFLARIVIGGKGINAPFDPVGAIEIFKKASSGYTEKYPTTIELEKSGYVDPENSYFDGSGMELFGYCILTAIVCAITCGIAAPWMICKITAWRCSHTVINGKRLVFNGTGGSLLGHWILWEILTAVTCGIFGFFMYVRVRKWALAHTFIEGEPIIPNANESYFDGGSLAFFGYGLLGTLILMITCTLAFPWVSVWLYGWDTGHQVINGRRLTFSGTGLGLLKEYLIILVFSVITCGIYAPWGAVRMEKYFVRNTDFVI